MGTLFVYIIKSALCLTLLYLPYTLLLRKEKLHSLNRTVLLGILVVSFLLPALHGQPFGNLSFSCQAKGIQGRVLLKLIIQKDGSISDKVEVVKSPHPDLTAEAKRVVSLMPKWVPGKQNGKPVSSYFAIPMGFRLQ